MDRVYHVSPRLNGEFDLLRYITRDWRQASKDERAKANALIADLMKLKAATTSATTQRAAADFIETLTMDIRVLNEEDSFWSVNRATDTRKATQTLMETRLKAALWYEGETGARSVVPTPPPKGIPFGGILAVTAIVALAPIVGMAIRRIPRRRRAKA